MVLRRLPRTYCSPHLPPRGHFLPHSCAAIPPVAFVSLFFRGRFNLRGFSDPLLFFLVRASFFNFFPHIPNPAGSEIFPFCHRTIRELSTVAAFLFSSFVLPFGSFSTTAFTASTLEIAPFLSPIFESGSLTQSSLCLLPCRPDSIISASLSLSDSVSRKALAES